MAANIRPNTKSIINVLGTTTYLGVPCINIFNKINLDYNKLNNIQYYEEYIIKNSDRWDIISNNFYRTPNLYWLILAFNQIQDPFASFVVGLKIKIIRPEYLTHLLIELRGL